jgi:hypothetical protein
MQCAAFRLVSRRVAMVRPPGLGAGRFRCEAGQEFAASDFRLLHALSGGRMTGEFVILVFCQILADIF